MDDHDRDHDEQRPDVMRVHVNGELDLTPGRMPLPVGPGAGDAHATRPVVAPPDPDAEQATLRAAEQAALRAFADELRLLRELAGMSQRDLAKRLDYSYSLISHLQGCGQAPSEEFARRADQALGSGRRLQNLQRAYALAHARTRPTRALPAPPPPHPTDAEEDPAPHATPADAPRPDDADRDGAARSGVQRPGIVMHNPTGVQIGDGTNTQHFTF